MVIVMLVHDNGMVSMVTMGDYDDGGSDGCKW